jgi:hypothetical protein
MKNFISVPVLLLSFCAVKAQVGVGTTSPTAQLEIAANTNTPDLPLLELAPQASPMGTATGQLAIIDDKLFAFDAARSKWLSVETTALQFGYAYDADDQELFFGGDIGLDTASEGLTGAKMPYDGTIVYMTIESSGGAHNKSFDIALNGSNIGNNTDPALDGRVNLSSNEFMRTNYNIDFNQGDYITIKARANGPAVHDPVALIWVKWRH